MQPVEVIQGNGPVILGQPHSGTFVPDDIYQNLNPLGWQLVDTDWHIPQLYEGLLENVTTVRANFSRYVIDPNRDPEGTSLYPGQNTTELVPMTTFDGDPIWLNPPTQDDIFQLINLYHSEYHRALRSEIERVKSQHGIAVLYDCHSIRSQASHLFDGRLPDLNIGTNSGASCSTAISQAVLNTCANTTSYSHVLNGRFKGGWTTRHYGDPANNVHALQMELAQLNYLETEIPPFTYHEASAAKLRKVLQRILQNIQHTIDTSLQAEL